jgi:uncharacterized membrane protein YbhN (UPF0104 family)
MSAGLRTWLGRAFWLALFGLLLAWALKDAPLGEIRASLRSLQAWQVGALAAINLLIFGLITARWWIIVRAENVGVPFLPLIGYRLSVFGLSYFTVGPQLGGEPLQVLYLQKYHRLTSPRATAAVIMDKLVEFLANFVFLAVGLYALVDTGLLAGSGGRLAAGAALAAVVLLWPAVHIGLLYRGRHPLTAVLRALHLETRQAFRLIVLAERRAVLFCRRHPGALLSALGVSLLAWAGMLAEYGLMLRFLSLPLTAWQSLAAVAAIRLAFLMPLPGGLGALEAAQVFVLTGFGLPAAAGIGLSLLMRGRDLLLGGVGLLLAGGAYNR